MESALKRAPKALEKPDGTWQPPAEEREVLFVCAGREADVWLRPGNRQPGPVLCGDCVPRTTSGTSDETGCEGF